MKLTMLGTGNALVTECYNTCFLLDDDHRYLLVDAGGGNTILHQLKRAGVDWRDVRDIFVTHKHIDHLMGVVWMMRMICQHMRQNEYEGNARIYAHAELIPLIRQLGEALLQKKEVPYLGTRLELIPVADGEVREIIGHRVQFFDIGSTKAKQFGFTLTLADGARLTCCGDEPYNEAERPYAEGSKWLMHEAFCLFGQADVFKPYEKHHSTALDAARLAESLNVPNLILYHTEDKTLADRKQLYTAEAQTVYHGSVYVPDDLEEIEIG